MNKCIYCGECDENYADFCAALKREKELEKQLAERADIAMINAEEIRQLRERVRELVYQLQNNQDGETELMKRLKRNNLA